MTPTSSMTVDKTSWHCLPAEIRIMILEALLQDGCSLAAFATVSREWQTIIEPHNFARIKLTPSRLAGFGPVLHRNRALVRYIWLCLELEEYGRAESAPEDVEMEGVSRADNTLIVTAFLNLFSTLGTWEPNGSLLLDISVHSPSDSEHWFHYLTFEPDMPSDECHWGQCAEQSMLAKVNDHHDPRDNVPTCLAIYNVFDEIMCKGPFDAEEEESRWWQQLPLVPAVTAVLLRQQTRRRWGSDALANMFSRLPRLQEIHYEPWREWCDDQQRWTDKFSYGDSYSSKNFNQLYPRYCMPCKPIRVPAPDVSRAVAITSLALEHLSASFMVDATYFFNAREPCWKWLYLTSLTPTSRLLTPDESPGEMDDMLKMAAAAAMKMPNLQIMEIWNGRRGLAALFRYQPAGRGQPAVLTWRGTWDFDLRPPVIRAWEAVTRKYHGYGSVVVEELVYAGTIRCHGDAIHHLKLSSTVIRPVSLRQIRMEHIIHDGVGRFPPIIAP